MPENNVARIWRNDGVIEYVCPPPFIVNTLFAFASSHDPWICSLMEEMYLFTKDVKDMPEQMQEVLPALGAMLIKSHGAPVVSQPRVVMGNAEEFDGMAIGTMHPTELYMLSVHCMDMSKFFAEVGKPRNDMQLIDTLEFWVEAAKKLVRPAEQLATVAREVNA